MLQARSVFLLAVLWAVSSAHGAVLSGADVLAEQDYSALHGRRVGVVASPATVLRNLTHLVDAMWASPAIDIRAVFGAEHGFRGDQQAGHGSDFYHDNRTGLPVYSTYRRSGDELAAVLRNASVDTIVFDIQDVGVRFYTFVWSMWDIMSVCQSAGIRDFFVLDRPNPLGGEAVRGNILDPAFSSFIGRLPIALQHGMTIGELAKLFNEHFLPQSQRVALTVIPMQGWHRSMLFTDTGLPWVLPSPNMPTETTALVYAGLGLLEGTNMSEGRGTTRPFEIFGASYLTWKFYLALQELALPGVSFREEYFVPTFSKDEGNITCGVQVYVDARNPAYDSVALGLHVLATAKKQAPEGFGWLGSYGIDFHMGTNRTRLALDAGVPVSEIVAGWVPEMNAFLALRKQFLQYD
eukprot:m.32704 g.32704  ORF g.32704 m.32704 type:complete len:408 (-) comp5564_c0_seq2:74-1297(-)